MTEAGKEIVDIFKKNGKHTIAGNREYWEELYYIDGKIIYAGGETLGNTEDFREEITEEEALKKLKNYIKNKALVFDRDMALETDEQFLAYWTENRYV